MKRLFFLVLIFTIAFGLLVNADLGDRVLKKGMSGYDVNILQRYLNELGFFLEDEFTNYFGPITEDAVKAFQEEYGLEVDGKAGKETYKYINAKIKQINIIKSAKENLKNLGYYTGEINAIIDEETSKAIQAFQENEDLELTGKLDQITKDRLDELFPPEAEEDKNSISGRALVDFTRKYLGKPYSYGAASGNAFDCSGFSTYVMKNYGISLKRRASEQAREGIPVESKSELKVGDLVFFSQSGRSVDHVGIYIGDSKFIHASSYKRGVVIDSFNRYTGVYMGARRYLNVKEE